MRPLSSDKTSDVLPVFMCALCVRVSVSTRTLSDGSRKSDTPLNNHDPRTAVQLRTALKRLKEIMEGKSQVFCLNNHRKLKPCRNTKWR